jgi:transposase
VADTVAATLQTKPAGSTHWSTRTLAAAQGVSKNTIHRLWQDHQLKPHLTKRFKLSRDPKFLEKLTDVVGVYLTPPQNAVVLCVDEKSQIQALDRTQPGLPLKPGRCGTFTHDYERHGTTTLFAALQVLEGRVIGQCYPRQRHQEFLKFLRRLDAEFPDPVTLHLILDNYGTHGHERVRRWLAKNPRFVLHFIPTSSSWLNLVERWFTELSEKAVRRGVFHSVQDLQQAINEFTAAWNANPSPFVWTASVAKILEKLARCQQRLEQIQPGCTKTKGKIK